MVLAFDKYFMQIGLKKIEVSQSIELHELAVQTFDETFASQNTPKNMQWYFETTMTLENTEKRTFKSRFILLFCVSSRTNHRIFKTKF
jgi:hypothetical protein